MFSGLGLTKFGGGEKLPWEGEWDCAFAMGKEKSHPVQGGDAGVLLPAGCSGQFKQKRGEQAS